MRIIAGRLGGRVFDAPPGHRTHPMSGKARGGLFNALGDISGLSVLDAFAGSGALGIEAISRGAARALAIEVDNSAYKTIQANLQKLDLQNSIKVVRANIAAWSVNNPDVQFDLVLADPPHDKLNLSLVQKLAKHVQPGGLLVLSWPARMTPPEMVGLEMFKTQNYGDLTLTYYHNRDKVV